MAAKPLYEQVGGAVTPLHDLYFAVVATVMFLAGCAIAMVNRYQPARERKRGNSKVDCRLRSSFRIILKKVSLVSSQRTSLLPVSLTSFPIRG